MRLGAVTYNVFLELLRRYTLSEARESKEPERSLRWHKALWTELVRSCS